MRGFGSDLRRHQAPADPDHRPPVVKLGHRSSRTASDLQNFYALIHSYPRSMLGHLRCVGGALAVFLSSTQEPIKMSEVTFSPSDLIWMVGGEFLASDLRRAVWAMRSKNAHPVASNLFGGIIGTDDARRVIGSFSHAELEMMRVRPITDSADHLTVAGARFSILPDFRGAVVYSKEFIEIVNGDKR